METYHDHSILSVLESIALWNGVFCLVTAFLFNTLIIFCIIQFSPPHMGMYYRVVQGSLSACNIAMAWLVLSCRPTMHVHSGLFLFASYPTFPLPRSVILIFTYSFLFLFVNNKGILSTLMVFRMIKMTRGQNDIHPLKLIALPLISLSITLPVFALLFYVLAPTKHKQNICFNAAIPTENRCTTIEEAIKQHLPPDTEFLLAIIEGDDMTNWLFFISMFLLVLVLLISSAVISIGARKIRKNATSRARNSLQRQLATALYLQSLVPSILVQIPIGIGVIGTLCNMDMDFFFHLLPIVSAWYTAIDPLMIFHNVRSYRRGLINLLVSSLLKGSPLDSTYVNPIRKVLSKDENNQTNGGS